MKIPKQIPTLRFPEFKDEWEKKKVDKIAELTSSKRVYLSEYVDEGIPFYRGKEISELKLNKTPNDILFISKESYEKYKKLYGVPEIGDILMTAVGTLGNVLRISNSSPFYFKDGNLIWFRRISENSKFLERLLEFHKKEIHKTSIGSTQRALTMVELRKLKFSFPSLPEQQKISSFHSSVDEKINQLVRKKELLEEYKIGVIQKIFNRKVRFKDGNGSGFPDWKKKKLGDVLTFIGTNSLSRNMLNDEVGEVRNIHYGDIHTKFKSNFIVQEEQVPYINKNVDLSKLKSDQYCKVGDIVIADASEDYNDIGKTIEIIDLKDEKVLAGLHTILGRDKIPMSVGFKGYLFQTDFVKKQIMKMASGISVLGISKSNLMKVNVEIPDIREQEKIVKFITSIDKKINLVQNQLDEMKDWNKGLLQQMFV